MKIIAKMLLLLIVAGAVIQIVPYGKNRTNPALVREPAWNNPQTRELAKRACFDCHSNETVWPWYSKVAPLSWLVYWDVVEGRKHLNFSDWRGGARKAELPHEITKEVMEGDMPPIQYIVAHPAAKLDGQSRKLLIDGLAATASGPARQ